MPVSLRWASLSDFRSLSVGVHALQQLTLVTQVGSCCGAAYLQAETAFVSVRAGTAEQPHIVQPKCLTFVVYFLGPAALYCCRQMAQNQINWSL